jgi:protein-tyrosine phosphatase
MSLSIVDLHTHVIPGVDDGANDLDESVVAISALVESSVTAIVATPHFRASLQEQPRRARSRLELFDAGWHMLQEAVAKAGLEVRLERGCELKLDAPRVDIADDRLRLAGTRYVLVEFAALQLPPFAGNQLAALREADVTPVLAHPERYVGFPGAFERAERWREEGTLFQVNGGSLLGRYGRPAEGAARELLRRGWVDCVASDYHARGELDTAAVRDWLAKAEDGEEIAELLMSTNPGRLLAGQDPVEVPSFEPAESARRSGLRRWLG